MALIICKHCGQKISDTVEVCIHCGTLINGESFVQKEEDLNSISTPDCDENKKRTQYDYNKYDEDIRIQLEQEFLTTDKWARSFRRKSIEIEKFKSLFYWGLILPILIVIAARYCYSNIFKESYYNEIALGIAGFGVAFLFTVSLILTVILFFKGIVYKRCLNKYIYMKKYQRWLSEEKGVRYAPVFLDKKSREKFDKLDIDKIKF